MAFRQSPAPELLTFRNWYTVVDRAPDGSGFPSGTYSEFQTSGIRTRAAKGTVEIANFDLTVAVVKRRSWIVMSQATPALLEHERLHFLIAVCVGRDLHEDAFSTSAASLGRSRQRSQKPAHRRTEAGSTNQRRLRSGDQERHPRNAASCVVHARAPLVFDRLQGLVARCLAGHASFAQYSRFRAVPPRPPQAMPQPPTSVRHHPRRLPGGLRASRPRRLRRSRVRADECGRMLERRCPHRFGRPRSVSHARATSSARSVRY